MMTYITIFYIIILKKNLLKNSLEFSGNTILKFSLSIAEVSLQKTTMKYGHWWNTFCVDEDPLSFRKLKTHLFSNQNENNQRIIETWKKLKYIKSTNGNQELQNIQKEFSQGQAKIILFFSKEEQYELEL